MKGILLFFVFSSGFTEANYPNSGFSQETTMKTHLEERREGESSVTNQDEHITRNITSDAEEKKKLIQEKEKFFQHKEKRTLELRL